MSHWGTRSLDRLPGCNCRVPARPRNRELHGSVHPPCSSLRARRHGGRGEAVLSLEKARLVNRGLSISRSNHSPTLPTMEGGITTSGTARAMTETRKLLQPSRVLKQRPITEGVTRQDSKSTRSARSWLIRCAKRGHLSEFLNGATAALGKSAAREARSVHNKRRVNATSHPDFAPILAPHSRLKAR